MLLQLMPKFQQQLQKLSKRLNKQVLLIIKILPIVLLGGFFFKESQFELSGKELKSRSHAELVSASHETLNCKIGEAKRIQGKLIIAFFVNHTKKAQQRKITAAYIFLENLNLFFHPILGSSFREKRNSNSTESSHMHSRI